VPTRTCIGCRATAEQAELRRYVLVDGAVVRDDERRLPGRGAYLHDDEACREQADRRRAWGRAFRRRVTPASSQLD